MDTLGITPIEAAFEAIGLGFCQRINAYIFKETSLGLVVMTAGFLVSLLSCVKAVNYRWLIQYIILSFSLYFIFIFPVSNPPVVTSSMETNGYQAIRSVDIVRDANIEKVPTILSFVARMLDAAMIGSIYVLPVGNYLKSPFEINKTVFGLQNELEQGIKDPQLHRQVSQFFYDHYLPALSMMPQKKAELWPGHSDVVHLYTPQGQQAWGTLKVKLQTYINSSNSFWPKARDILSGLRSTPNQEPTAIDEAFLADLLARQMQESSKRKTFVFSVLWFLSGQVIAFFPYIIASVSLLLYSLFPFVIIFVLLTNKPIGIFHYLLYLCALKFLVWAGALVSAISFLVCTVQAHLAPGFGWFWQMPYFNLLAAGLLLIVPFVTISAVNRLSKGGV